MIVVISNQVESRYLLMMSIDLGVWARFLEFDGGHQVDLHNLDATYGVLVKLPYWEAVWLSTLPRN